MDDVVPTCHQVLRMATEDGAATTPYAGQIGTLEPGKAADLVVLSWQQIAAPYLSPDTSVVDAVVHRAKTNGVSLVMVAGEVVLRDGRFTRVDKAALLEELAGSLRAPLTSEEEDRRRLSRAVFPVVKSFYDGWLDEDARVPFYRPSSRV
jgi:N-acyl-D-aspartate/D-glutamate deacylase